MLATPRTASPPKVSVNIPVYNGEKTIAQAVQSILDQTFTDFELVVVNDCSRDTTPQILNSFSDPRLKIVHHEQNQGISRTRNTALRNSQGELIAVLDADDLARPERLDRQVSALEREAALDGVFSWVQIFTGDPQAAVTLYRPRFKASEMREVVLFESPFGHSSACLRKATLGAGYREDLACAEDYAKWLELVFAGKLLGVIPEPLVRVWSHPPTSYTNEKMKANIQKLQLEYFRRLLGRDLTADEVEAQWALYEFTTWQPATRAEAKVLLEKALRWISTLGRASILEPSIDRARLSYCANSKLYFLSGQAAADLRLRIIKYARNMTPEQQLKILVKGAIGWRPHV